MEKLFCVEVTLTTGDHVVHHTIALDSQQAFRNTEKFLSEKSLSSKSMNCNIVSKVDGFNIIFSK